MAYFFGGDRKLKVKNTQKKKKGRSVQELLGIKTFTKYGLSTNKGELLFYPTVFCDYKSQNKRESPAAFAMYL